QNAELSDHRAWRELGPPGNGLHSRPRSGLLGEGIGHSCGQFVQTMPVTCPRLPGSEASDLWTKPVRRARRSRRCASKHENSRQTRLALPAGCTSSSPWAAGRSERPRTHIVVGPWRWDTEIDK